MSFYQKTILIGLIFSTVGDVFLIDQKRFFGFTDVQLSARTLLFMQRYGLRI